jgi:endonuclease/exonuclease/phosphatase (EEP) superfamily protein YafD
MIIATALPIFRKEAWWIRIFDFPRLQITVITAFTLIAYLLLGENPGVAGYLFLAALIACLIYQGYRIYPYTFFSPKQVQRSRNPSKQSNVSLLFANVLMGNHNAARLKQIIREVDPDIILTLETDQWWKDQLQELEQTYPFTVLQPQDNTYGMLLYSRLEFINPEVKFLIQNDVPSMHTRIKLPSGQEIALHCVHPKPPFPTEDESSTERDAELLIIGREIKKKHIPVIVMGDLNDVGWSRTSDLFQNISGLLDPRIGRGFYNTFHAKYPFLRFPLDHFFHSNHFRMVNFKRLEYFGSDHFPVFITLSYEPEAKSQQEELHANGSEQKEAKEKIEEAT